MMLRRIVNSTLWKRLMYILPGEYRESLRMLGYAGYVISLRGGDIDDIVSYSNEIIENYHKLKRWYHPDIESTYG